jgi:hypothetical protein
MGDRGVSGGGVSGGDGGPGEEQRHYGGKTACGERVSGRLEVFAEYAQGDPPVRSSDGRGPSRAKCCVRA